tara:strand:- start:120 stop:1760 length:1641 start_codon:yes stop_codon:yes gene_type:complete
MSITRKVILKDGRSFASIREASESFGIPYKVLCKRLKKPNCSIEIALEIEKPIDPMIGSKFADLTVLGVSRKVPKRGLYYQCQCDCGKVIERWGSALRSGAKKQRLQSCGCRLRDVAKERASKKIGIPKSDLTGKPFGFLSVVGLSDEQGQRNKRLSLKWDCRCVCQNFIKVRGSDLTNGSTKSCGCRGERHGEDWTGQSFGKLTVIERNGKVWKTECVCGRINSYNKKKIITESGCGCSVPKNPLGWRSGKLTVIQRPESDEIDNRRKWTALCDCGKETSVREWELFHGRVQSCGCISNSEFKQSDRYLKASEDMLNWYNDIISDRLPKAEDINLILDKLEIYQNNDPLIQIARSESKGIIYLAKHIPSSRGYIGQTFSRKNFNSEQLLEDRRKRHIRSAKSPKTYFSNALKKYSEDEFKWTVVFCATDSLTLNIAEYMFIRIFETSNEEKGFNSIVGGVGVTMFSRSVRTKMGSSAKTRWANLSSGDRRRLTEKQHSPSIPFQGKLVYARDLADIVGVSPQTIRNYLNKGMSADECLVAIRERR